jgi:hypothetical protein
MASAGTNTGPGDVSELAAASDKGDVEVGLGNRLVSGKGMGDCREMRAVLLAFLCRFNGEVIPSNRDRCIPVALKDRFDGDWTVADVQLRDETLSANPSSI